MKQRELTLIIRITNTDWLSCWQ